MNVAAVELQLLQVLQLADLIADYLELVVLPELQFL